MTAPATPRLGVIACSVFESELAQLAAGAAHVLHHQFFEIGLHDQPDRLRATLQEAIDQLAKRNDLDAIALLYGLCGKGTAGLTARRVPLVLPRAHDCITLFLGSKERYAEHHATGRYFYTPGWNRARRVPGPDREAALRSELSARFEPDDVDYLIEQDRATWAGYHTATFLDLGTPDAEREAAYAASCAHALGWRYERWAGDATLLCDLLWGRWDDTRFQVVPPGATVRHAVDKRIVCIDPPAGASQP